MIFTKIAELLAGNTAVTLLVTGNKDALNVTLIPKPSKTGEGVEALGTPMILSGTAAELDAGFADLIGQFDVKQKSLAEQFEATAAVIEAAKKASSEKAAKAVTSTAKSAAKKPGATAAAAEDDVPSGDDDDAQPQGDGAKASADAQQPATAPTSNLFG